MDKEKLEVAVNLIANLLRSIKLTVEEHNSVGIHFKYIVDAAKGNLPIEDEDLAQKVKEAFPNAK